MVVDVDEVLGMFVRGFERFLESRGYEMRLTTFALFQNIYRPGDTQHLDVPKGRLLFDEYFGSDAEHMDVAPGGAEALEALSAQAGVVILTNAPSHGRDPRARWLAKNRLDYPLIINSGLKGGVVAALAAKTTGPVVFIDDLLPNLDSVATDAPAVRRFQSVADERLRPLAFSAPDRHERHDEWHNLHAAIEAAIRS